MINIFTTQCFPAFSFKIADQPEHLWFCYLLLEGNSLSPTPHISVWNPLDANTHPFKSPSSDKNSFLNAAIYLPEIVWLRDTYRQCLLKNSYTHLLSQTVLSVVPLGALLKLFPLEPAYDPTPTLPVSQNVVSEPLLSESALELDSPTMKLRSPRCHHSPPGDAYVSLTFKTHP